MSNGFIFRQKPVEFKADPVEGVDLTHPVGVDTEMYAHVGDDENGNHVLVQVGVINFPDTSDKTKFDVLYDAEYEGPRDHESDASKEAREVFLAQKAAQEEEDAKEVPDDNGEVQSGSDEGEVSGVS